jgi:hypothetical protein
LIGSIGKFAVEVVNIGALDFGDLAPAKVR